jgi:hypothetical protein
LCFAFGQPVNAQQSASTSEESGLVSPDKQWEYEAPSAGEDARIAKAGSNDIAVSLVDDCDIGCEHASVLWAPDSKRFAFNRGDGKARLTSVYELREGKWQELQSLREDDAIQQRTYGITKAQAKRKVFLKNLSSYAMVDDQGDSVDRFKHPDYLFFTSNAGAWRRRRGCG